MKQLAIQITAYMIAAWIVVLVGLSALDCYLLGPDTESLPPNLRPVTELDTITKDMWGLSLVLIALYMAWYFVTACSQREERE